ncbi:MAG: vanadium-dependent haloperoxidase [Silvanigrellales bacterium]|jgi:hypothetical protein|nr:vanadium-dependent haloperoxidase [Silvanigrellales bacterium]
MRLPLALVVPVVFRLVPFVVVAGFSTGHADVGLEANHYFLAEGKVQRLSPPLMARNLALFHLASWKAVRALESDSSDDVQRARVLGAFRAVWANAFDWKGSDARAWHDESLAKLQQNSHEPAALLDAWDEGRRVGTQLVDDRREDLAIAQAPDHLAPPWADGFPTWTPGAHAKALHPRWGEVRPLVAQGVHHVPTPPSPAMSSFTRDVILTARMGAEDAAGATPETQMIARFWEQGSGTVTPPGQWNVIAVDFARGAGLSLREEVQFFAQLNVALFDASIHCWREKYRHRAPRPVDVMTALFPNLGWTPLLATPPHPEYPSGHSTFSAAAAEVVEHWNAGGVKPLSVTSEDTPGVVRRFADAHALAREAGLSRIYGGIHFPSANQAGLQLGKEVGRVVVLSLSSEDAP